MKIFLFSIFLLFATGMILLVVLLIRSTLPQRPKPNDYIRFLVRNDWRHQHEIMRAMEKEFGKRLDFHKMTNHLYGLREQGIVEIEVRSAADIGKDPGKLIMFYRLTTDCERRVLGKPIATSANLDPR